MNRKKILVFNWKMNPTKKKDALKLFSDIKKLSSRVQKEKKAIDFIVAPPAVYLDAINLKNKNTKIALAGQDNFYKNSGSVTGGVSWAMLKDLGAKYSIVGHWERRSLFGETDEDVSKKIKIVLENKNKVILCVGEEKRDLKGKFADFLERQIIDSLRGVEKFHLKNIILAYEPVWAIGQGGRKVTVEELEQSIVLIKKILKKKFGEESKKVKLLYGGSVSQVNAKELGGVMGLDGFLLGRASLSKDSFEGVVNNLF